MRKLFEEQTSALIICIVVSLLLCITGSFKGIDETNNKILGTGLLKIAGDNLIDAMDTFQKQAIPNENLIQKNTYYTIGKNPYKNCIPSNDGSIIFNYNNHVDTYFRIMLKEPLKAGDIYTFSCEVSNLKNDDSFGLGLLWQTKNQFTITKNGKVSKTFVVDDKYDGYTYLLVDDLKKASAPVTIKNIKLEKGRKLTSYIE